MSARDREKARQARVLEGIRKRLEAKIARGVQEPGTPNTEVIKIDFTCIKGVGKGTQKKIDKLFEANISAIAECTPNRLMEMVGVKEPVAIEIMKKAQEEGSVKQ